MSSSSRTTRRAGTSRTTQRKRIRDDEIALGEDEDTSKVARPEEVPIAPATETTTAVVEDPFALVTDHTVATGVIFGAESEAHDAREPRGRTGIARIMDTEEAVRRQIGILAPDAAQQQRLFVGASKSSNAPPFVLRGLSQVVPNVKYQEVAEQRKRFEDQRAYIVKQRELFDRLFHNTQLMQPLYFREQFDAERIAFLQGFQPPQALVLIIPPSKKIELTAYWRRHLGDAAEEEMAKYKYNPILEFGTRFLGQQLIGYHVRPIVLRRLEQLKNSTYEDMPITLELLEKYFVEYINGAYNRLMTLATSTNPDVMYEDVHQSTDLTSLGEAFTSTYEAAPEMFYYASVLTLNANRTYRTYLTAWIASKKFSPEVEQDKVHQATISTLETFVNNMIRTYDRYQSNTNNKPYFHSSRPLSILTYKNQFRRLLFLEIAKHRADNLVTSDVARSMLAEYFSARDAMFDAQILLNMSLQFPALLDMARDEALEALPNANDNNDPNVGFITDRYDAAIASIRKLWPNYPSDPRGPHSPIDPPTAQSVDVIDPQTRVSTIVVDKFSPHDLSYPIDEVRTQQMVGEIQSEIDNIGLQFDPNETHDMANRRRTAMGVLYANRVLAVELSQAEYLLRNVLSPTVEVPLVVDRMIYDTSELVLRVHFELSPLLASRIIYATGGDEVLLDGEAKDALATLEKTEFVVSWYHRPLYGNKEEEFQQQVVTGMQEATLILTRSGDDIDNAGAIMQLAGRYRAVARLLSNTDISFESVFEATVNVLAQCIRDGKTFTPTFGVTRHHGECIWRPTVPTPEHCNAVDELQILATRGAEEYKTYKKTQKDNAANAGGAYVAPWGASTTENLRRVALMTPENIAEMFTVRSIIGQFIERFAGNVRMLGNQGATPLPANDMQLFVRAVQAFTVLYKAESDAAEWLLQPRSLDEPAVIGLRQMVQAASRVQSLTLADGLDVQTSSAEFGTDVECAPIAGLIRLLRTPFAAAMQTGRERRFVSKMQGDLNVFAKLYKQVLASRNRVVLDTQHPHYSPEAAEFMEKRFDANLETLRVSDVHGLVISESMQLHKLFIDTASSKELENKIVGLPRTVLEPVRPTSIDNMRHLWRGSHTFVTSMPDLLVVGRSPATVAGTDLPKKLFIVQRGSEPLSRGYDYNTLYEKFLGAFTEYNASTTQMLYVEVARRVTIYNYFAFLAPPLSPGSFLEGEVLEHRIIDGAYRHLTLFEPTPFEEINS